jgi:hypothetical protein
VVSLGAATAPSDQLKEQNLSYGLEGIRNIADKRRRLQVNIKVKFLKLLMSYFLTNKSAVRIKVCDRMGLSDANETIWFGDVRSWREGGAAFSL